MAEDDGKKDDVNPTVLEEPGTDEANELPENIWLRGLWMLFFVAALWVARALVIIAGVIQFFWMLFGTEKNHYIAEFGEDLADWMARATLYITGGTEDRPFPFDRWGIPD
ncbi:MAG: DUF4389 domain-containing protein [Maritimibacter harenae]|jgi:hypothetical protein